MAKGAILIIENEAIVAAHLAREVDVLGYRVLGVAPTGEEAIRIAEREQPDLILTDIRLGGSLDGIETARRLRALWDIPVIFITGHSDQDTLKRASLAGSFGYILKPWDTRDLSTQLEIAFYKHQADQALRDSEERYRAFISNSSEGIWRIEFTPPLDTSLPVDVQVEQVYRSARLVECNDAMARMYGLSKAGDLIGKSLDFMLPATDAAARDFLASVIRAGYRSTHVESIERDVNGQPVYFLNSMTGIVENGHLVRMWGTQQDITDRKQAEQARRESEARFAGFMTHLPGLAWIKDHTGRYVFANEAALHAFGKPRHEVYGRNDDELFLPATARQFQQNDRTVLSSGAPVEIIEELEHSDGHHYSLVNKFPIPSDAGMLIGGIALDVTRHRTAEEALQRSEALYRAIGESIDYGVWVCAPDGRNTYASESFLKLVGLTQEQCSNLGWGSVLHPDDVDATIAAWQACVKDGSLWDREHRFRGVDGQWHHILARGVPVKDEQGQILCWAGINLDISRLKRSQEQLRQSEARLEIRVEERTNALVQSQEQLRALANQLSLTEQRERKRLAMELHDHLAQMLVLASLKMGQAKRTAGDRATELAAQTERIISECLSYTRTLVAELSPPVLHDHGLAAGLRWLGDYMKKYDMTVAVHAPEEEPTLAEEHAALMFQSVRELLMNIWKHSGVGHATVTMERQDTFLRIEVRDSGKGFAIEAPDGSSSKFGLFSIRERLKTVGGSFHIESAPGLGTRCLLELQLPQRVLQDPATAPSRLEQARDASLTPPSIGIRVLLVDDHAMMRQGLRTVLQSYTDIEIIGECSNGKEAVEAVDQLLPAVVIMDINMPVMNGIEATARIKAHHPGTIVIGLSVNANHENEVAMTAAGAAMLLTKEAAVDQLYSAIQKTAQQAAKNHGRNPSIQ